MAASDIELAESVLQETESIIAAVKPDQLDLPTPCSEYDVAALINHVVGWGRNFAGRFSGQLDAEDPNEFSAGPHPDEEFRDAARTIVIAYRSNADATKQLPVGFMVMEFLTHGWDLATAINRPTDYSAAGAELGLRTATNMLKPEYRGDSFKPPIEVDPTAGAVERLMAFMGRDPHWRPPT